MFNEESKEKGALLVVLAGIGLVILAYLSYKFTAMVNVQVILAVVILAEEAFILPTVNKYYHEFHGLEAPKTRWIPVWNELMLFRGWVYLACTILTISSGVAVLLASPLITYLPLAISTVMTVTTYALYALIACLLALCVVRGIGFIRIKREVDQGVLNTFGKPPGVLSYLLYISMLLPIVRCLGLSYMIPDMQRLSANEVYYDMGDEDEEEELYEN